MRPQHALLPLAAALLALSCPLSLASESDPYTYRDVKLRDSAWALSNVAAVFIGDVVWRVNERIREAKAKGSALSDTDKEHLFFSLFHERHVSKSDVWSPFETCVVANDCSGWPFIERIVPRRNENIYATSAYNQVAGDFATAVLNLCGVRVGADKLTHMFLDGFLYYNCTQDKEADLSLDDVRRGSEAIEDSLMGVGLTGVHSHADVEANLMGVRFYRDLFSGPSSILKTDSDGMLKFRRFPYLCDYVHPGFDEVLNPNSHAPKPRLRGRSRFHRDLHQRELQDWRRRMTALKREIRERQDQARFRESCTTEEQKRDLKSMLIARPPDPVDGPGPLEFLLFGTTAATDWLLSEEIREGFRPYVARCLDRRSRKPTSIAP